MSKPIQNSGGTISQGDIHAMTNRNTNTKGMSTRVVIVAEATNSRTDSNARKLAANEPTEAGRSAMPKPSTRSMIRADSVTSMRLPAVSRMYDRRIRNSVSNSIIRNTPMASTHKVSSARLGTTRS